MAQHFSPKIVTTGLVFYLDAANVKSYPGTGITWSDLSSNGINGSLTNGPLLDSDGGGSMSFDGTDDYATLGISSTLDATMNGATNWTISYWVKYTQDGRILDAGDLGNDLIGGLELNTTAIVVNNTASTSSMTASLTSSNWNCICLTKNSSRLHSWYLNGSFSNSQTTTLDYTVSGQTWKIGRRSFNTAAILGGKIAQISIYNRVLAEDEILQNFNAIRGRFNI